MGRENLEPPVFIAAADILAPAVTVEFSGQNLEGTVILPWPQNAHADWTCHEVGQLKPGRVCLLVGEDDLEREQRFQLVLAVADAAELQFKILVFLLAAAFEHDVGLLGVLVLLDEKLVECLEAEPEAR